jgi:oxygen-independent coproporphyrinogen-3 oxidase
MKYTEQAITRGTMKVESNTPQYEKDLLELARAFYPKNSSTEEGVTILHSLKYENDCIVNNIQVTDMNGAHKTVKTDNKELLNKMSIRKILHRALYECLSEHLKVELPWGSLVGVRPVKLAKELLMSGVNRVGLVNHLKREYYISDKKANLVSEIIENQGKIIENDKLIDLYINIPFCTTRCSYCSFISAKIGKCKTLVEPYVEALIEEIRFAKELIAKNNFIVKTIYVGGGTPTSLSATQLEGILRELSFPVNEFTVEAGRSDTITKEKLDVLKKYGVTRISINPQSFNETVLKKAGRNHSVKEVFDAYKLALNYDFLINMDLIAGLSGETLKSFKQGIDTIIEMAPANVTVHTLSLKRASVLNKNNENIFKKSMASKMLDYAYAKLKENDYKPYYMYRQKNMVDNLENIGFESGKTVCEFNIDSIDEHTSVLACGAGAISKRIYLLENRHERVANVKGIKEYIERLEEMKKRKDAAFS